MIQCIKTQAEREKKLKELNEKIDNQNDRLTDGWSDAEVEKYEIENSDWSDSRPIIHNHNPYKKGGHNRCNKK